MVSAISITIVALEPVGRGAGPFDQCDRDGRSEGVADLLADAAHTGAHAEALGGDIVDGDRLAGRMSEPDTDNVSALIGTHRTTAAGLR